MTDDTMPLLERLQKRGGGDFLKEQNDEWQLQHRYLTLETITGLADDAGVASPAALTKAA